MIPEDKILAMLAMQDQLNKKINPDWVNAGYAWHRAIMVEGVELMEHIGWKWWKKQEPDLAQARIELVDIWHFGMSMMMVETYNEGIVQRLVTSSKFGRSDIDIRECIDLLVQSAAQGIFNSIAFVNLMRWLGMSWDDLYRTYVAKNVLNTFRQDHGYKEGTYQKMWNGKEDNVCLDILMEAKPDATPDQLYAKLASVYANIFTLA